MKTFSSIFAALLYGFAAPVTAAGGIVKLKLHKASVDEHLVTETKTHQLNAIFKKLSTPVRHHAQYQTVLAPDEVTPDGRAVTLPINNILDMAFSVELQIGTPPRPFRFVVDTGSSNLWVFASKCRVLGCLLHNRYDPDSSSSYAPNGTEFQVKYVRGYVKGEVVSDTVRFGSIDVEHQLFGQVTSVQTSVFLILPIDGILGLGFNTGSVNNIPPPFYNMMQRGLVEKPMFSLYLSDSNNDENSSELILGGYDPSKFKGDLIKIPVVPSPYWTVNWDGIILGNERTDLGDVHAIIDSGSSEILLPSILAEIFYKRIGAKPSLSGIHTIPCDKRESLPDLTFTLSGHNFSLNGLQYTSKAPGGLCYTRIISMHPSIGPLTATLGAPFLRAWYSVYDYGDNTLSLARTKRN